MLTVTSIAGNIFHDKKFDSKQIQEFERIQVSRFELEKSRIRKQTNRGTDVGLALNEGKALHHGDILTNNEKFFVVEQLPEKVIAVRIKDANRPELLVLLGHIIGNRHRPISIKNETIYFPIQADSELEVFENLFSNVINSIELSIEEMIFHPEDGADVHDHG